MQTVEQKTVPDIVVKPSAVLLNDVALTQGCLHINGHDCDLIIVERAAIPALIGALLNAYCGKVPA